MESRRAGDGAATTDRRARESLERTMPGGAGEGNAVNAAPPRAEERAATYYGHCAKFRRAARRTLRVRRFNLVGEIPQALDVLLAQHINLNGLGVARGLHFGLPRRQIE